MCIHQGQAHWKLLPMQMTLFNCQLKCSGLVLLQPHTCTMGVSEVLELSDALNPQSSGEIQVGDSMSTLMFSKTCITKRLLE